MAQLEDAVPRTAISEGRENKQSVFYLAMEYMLHRLLNCRDEGLSVSKMRLEMWNRLFVASYYCGVTETKRRVRFSTLY